MPDERRGKASRDDDALTFDVRRGRDRGRPSRPAAADRRRQAAPSPRARRAAVPQDEAARAIPTGARQTRSRGQSPRPDPRRTEPSAQPRTRTMPTASRGTAQPPRSGSPAARPPRDRGAPPPRRRRNPLRTVGIAVLCLVLLWGGATMWAVSSAWSKVDKVAATPTGDRPSSDGRNVLLVGSDSRDDLTKEERERLGTGHELGGQRTDSIMLLHTGGDRPVLMSIPRDSYVEIPGYGMNKINAAYSLGGPSLLGSTVEQSTGLRVDGYMEIGFGGFAQVVDAVGGVDICVPRDMDDPKAHINLKKGCQTLDGKNALGYVRARYSDPEGDIGRAKRQRQFLGALMGQVATPSTVAQPWRVHSIGSDSAGALTVGEDDSMLETARAFLAMRTVAKGDGDSVVVPVASTNLPTAAGTAVEWDQARAQALFEDLRTNRPLSVKPTS